MDFIASKGKQFLISLVCLAKNCVYRLLLQRDWFEVIEQLFAVFFHLTKAI
jgi:hypothetical protein